MLKLERTSSSHHATLIFRDKDPLFSRPFFTALAIAVAIHMGLILLFHVAPIKIRWNSNASISTAVETDPILNTDSLVTANIEPDALPNNILLQAPERLPTLPESPALSNLRHIEHAKEPLGSAHLFTEIEKKMHQPLFSYIPPPQDPITVIITGRLAGNRVAEPKDLLPPSTIHSLASIKASQRVIYSVFVEAQSGKIFWHELIQGSADSSIKQISHAILNELKFTPKSEEYVTAGQIEFHFHPQQKKGGYD